MAGKVMMRQFFRSKALPLVLAILVVAWARANGATTLSSFLDLLGERVKHVVACENGFNVFCGANGQRAVDNTTTVDPSRVRGAKENLISLKEGPAEQVPYARKEWKHWVGDPCNAREAALKAQGTNVKTDASCRVLSGEWKSPYDGLLVKDPKALDVDHTIPLSYAARHGGQRWSPKVKEKFANDASHLVVTSAKSNRTKGDKGPEAYMPSKKGYHCLYAVMWVETADKYGITVTAGDKETLKKALNTCAE